MYMLAHDFDPDDSYSHMPEVDVTKHILFLQSKVIRFSVLVFKSQLIEGFEIMVCCNAFALHYQSNNDATGEKRMLCHCTSMPAISNCIGAARLIDSSRGPYIRPFKSLIRPLKGLTIRPVTGLSRLPSLLKQ